MYVFEKILEISREIIKTPCILREICFYKFPYFYKLSVHTYVDTHTNTFTPDCILREICFYKFPYFYKLSGSLCTLTNICTPDSSTIYSHSHKNKYKKTQPEA